MTMHNNSVVIGCAISNLKLFLLNVRAAVSTKLLHKVTIFLERQTRTLVDRKRFVHKNSFSQKEKGFHFESVSKLMIFVLNLKCFLKKNVFTLNQSQKS